jgi:hypothetical protein
MLKIGFYGIGGKCLAYWVGNKITIDYLKIMLKGNVIVCVNAYIQCINFRQSCIENETFFRC